MLTGSYIYPDRMLAGAHVATIAATQQQQRHAVASALWRNTLYYLVTDYTRVLTLNMDGEFVWNQVPPDIPSEMAAIIFSDQQLLSCVHNNIW